VCSGDLRRLVTEVGGGPDVVAALAKSGVDSVARMRGGSWTHAELRRVSAPVFPPVVWDDLTEIHLCHACSCQEILSVETARQVGLSTLRSRKLLMRALAEIQ
jgi:hypothetical protein